MQSGLPVLPGVVIPTSVSATLLETAARHALSRGVHAARLGLMDAAAPDLSDLESQIVGLGASLVVRSSSPLEEAAAYAGAFTSYIGVTPDEVATAVRGVWASALTVVNLVPARPGAQTHDGRPLMAVLVQQEVHPSFAGTARVSDEGVARVDVVRGSPAQLMAGWSRGETAEVDPGGTVTRIVATGMVDEAVVRQAAALARRVYQDLGDNLIEWAAIHQEVVLLQARTAASPAQRPTASLAPASGVMPRAAAGVARLLHRYAGALGEALILPVVLAGVRPDSGIDVAGPMGTVTQDEAVAAWAAAQALTRDLCTGSWGDAVTGTIGVSSALGKLRGGDVGAAMSYFASVPAVDSQDVDALLLKLDIVARWLEQSGVLISRDHFWAVGPGEVGDLIAQRLTTPSPSQRREAARRALLRWEPFVAVAVSGTGRVLHGEPVSGGTGVGIALTVVGIPTRPLPLPRMVLVAPNPIPQLAPLLWGTSALVTSGGSAAAHLVEVARSLGVPTVLGCDRDRLFSALGDRDASRTLIAVDGNSGRVVIDIHR